MDETTEREVRGAFKELADAMGQEKFNEFGMRFLLAMEASLRETMDADSPVIRMLDEHLRLHG